MINYIIKPTFFGTHASHIAPHANASSEPESLASSIRIVPFCCNEDKSVVFLLVKWYVTNIKPGSFNIYICELNSQQGLHERLKASLLCSCLGLLFCFYIEWTLRYSFFKFLVSFLGTFTLRGKSFMLVYKPNSPRSRYVRNCTHFTSSLRTDSYVGCREYCKQFEINTARHLLLAVCYTL